MKNWIINMAYGLLVMAFAITFNSCESKTERLKSRLENDSIVAQNAINNYRNPVMSTAEEVLDFRQCSQFDYETDSIFRSIPLPILKNVITVCLNRQNTVQKTDIIDEYLRNKKVYDNLQPKKAAPPDKQVQEDDTIMSLSITK